MVAPTCAMKTNSDRAEQEAYEVFDSTARYFVGMSAEEFIEAWNAGRFHDPDPDNHPGVIEIASVAPNGVLLR